ncbi:MAG: hypothetical protein ACRDHG_04620 [Anaerolineales bacterium]
MSRKDFELIAGVVRGLDNIIRDHVAAEFARVLGRTNPRFDADRFLKACE